MILFLLFDRRHCVVCNMKNGLGGGNCRNHMTRSFSLERWSKFSFGLQGMALKWDQWRKLRKEAREKKKNKFRRKQSKKKVERLMVRQSVRKEKQWKSRKRETKRQSKRTLKERRKTQKIWGKMIKKEGLLFRD